MDCHKLIYKSLRTKTPYENYIKNLREKQEQEKKREIYAKVLKFQQSRYPQQLLILLDSEINPFQLSLEKLKQFMASKYPEYSPEIINQSVQYIFFKKYEQAQIIKESMTIIQDGAQYIRNGRKLMKEDFQYQYNVTEKKNEVYSSPMPSTQRQGRNAEITPFSINTDRSKISHIQTKREQFSPSYVKQRSKTYSKAAQAAIINEKFNSMVADEIKQFKKQYQNIEAIYQNYPKDLIHLPKLQKDKKKGSLQQFGGFTGRSAFGGRSVTNGEGYTGRSQIQSLKFKEDDIIHNVEGGVDTSRSDLQQLQLLLSLGIYRQDRVQTSRSKKTNYPLKLNRDNLDNLYSADGSLKLGVVKKVITKMKKQSL